MNKKINFFKMFVLSSFLLGGIEVVQANIQYGYYDDDNPEAEEWQRRMELCHKDVDFLRRNNPLQAIHGYDYFFYQQDYNHLDVPFL